MKPSKKLAVTAAAVAALAAALLAGNGHPTVRDAGCQPTAAACPIFGPISGLGK